LIVDLGLGHRWRLRIELLGVRYSNEFLDGKSQDSSLELPSLSKRLELLSLIILKTIVYLDADSAAAALSNVWNP
jgi:hypothetical protein